MDMKALKFRFFGRFAAFLINVLLYWAMLAIIYRHQHVWIGSELILTPAFKQSQFVTDYIAGGLILFLTCRMLLFVVALMPIIEYTEEPFDKFYVDGFHSDFYKSFSKNNRRLSYSTGKCFIFFLVAVFWPIAILYSSFILLYKMLTIDFPEFFIKFITKES